VLWLRLYVGVHGGSRRSGIGWPRVALLGLVPTTAVVMARDHANVGFATIPPHTGAARYLASASALNVLVRGAAASASLPSAWLARATATAGAGGPGCWCWVCRVPPMLWPMAHGWNLTEIFSALNPVAVVLLLAAHTGVHCNISRYHVCIF
jgi:hypothetical protein